MRGRIKRRWRSKSRKIPLLPLIPAVHAAIIQPIFGGGGFNGAIHYRGNLPAAVTEFCDVVSVNFTGYKLSTGENFGWEQPIKTYSTILLGYAAHLLCNKLGVNRSLAKIPFVGKYIEL